MEELVKVLSEFGATGLWAVVLYKGIETLQLFGAFILIGWGIKKAWPTIKKAMEDY